MATRLQEDWDSFEATGAIGAATAFWLPPLLAEGEGANGILPFPFPGVVGLLETSASALRFSAKVEEASLLSLGLAAEAVLVPVSTAAAKCP